MIGLTLDYLIPLLGIIEGVSLWKVPAPTAEVPADNDEACEKIWRPKGSICERSDRMQLYRTLDKRVRFWQPIAQFECSLAPAVIFSIILLFVALLFEVTPCSAGLVTLNIIALGHVIFKSLIWIITYHYVKKFDEELKKLAPVPYDGPPPVTKL